MRGDRIQTEALVVGYAMSRLDRRYLVARGVGRWNDAFRQASAATGLPPASFKNLRDEFDPFFGNVRRGWRGRPIREDRQRVLVEFETVGEASLLALVERILSGDHEAMDPVLDLIELPPTRVANVADRLLTGRLAEDFFLLHCESILGFPRASIEDFRIGAKGYDFGVEGQPRLAVEVKGLRERSGGLLFTDREWTEASRRKEDYWLVVVGQVASSPRYDVVKDPVARLSARCVYQRSIAATWQASYRIVS